MRTTKLILVMILLLQLVVFPYQPALAQAPANTQQDTLTNNPSIDPDVDKPVVRKTNSAQTVYAPAITNEQLIELIQSILARLGFPPGTQVIIIPPAGSTPVPTPTPTPTANPTPRPTPTPTPSPTPQPTTPPPSSSSGPVKASDELRKTLQTKYGITADNGDIWWSERQIQAADSVLGKLPEGFRSATTSIKRDVDIPASLAPGMQGRVSGYVNSGRPSQVNMLNPSASGANLNDAVANFQGVLVHEMAHCFQFEHRDVAQNWARTFWPQGYPNPGSVSGYGNSAWYEDFAESVRTYFQAGARMKQLQPARYDFIRKYVMSGKEF